MEQVGRYALGRVLGHGGNGTVYEAHVVGVPHLGRVAVKVLNAGRTGMRREAWIGSLLRHRHLVDVYEVGESHGHWFCAMELCDGGPITNYLPLPPRAVVQVGSQICAALDYAHSELGLIHLDLKPDNLLIRSGAVKVADLGIARARGFGSDGVIRGTPGYMPPEQARGERVDARADVYALGITLLHLATGARPGASQTMDLSDDSEEAVWTARHEQGPDWLAEVLERCVAYDPADRWSSMRELAAALGSLGVRGVGIERRLGADETEDEHEMDRLIGRERELALVAAELRAGSSVVLCGPPGIGKSHLARAATGAEPATILCDLSAVSSREGFVSSVARSLELPLSSTVDPAEHIGWALLARGACTLVLDNVDRVVDHLDLATRWREAAPELRLLLTSRQAVDLGQRIDIGPLPAHDSEALLRHYARRRGVRVQADEDLRELATRLDGVPLALELAAGRLGVLSVRDVLDRLKLSLLRRATDDRHATLAMALEWSWALLGPAERAAFAKLSVFAGAFSLEAAASITGAPAGVIDELIDRSLLVRDGARVRFLRHVGEYARSKLDNPAVWESRHGAHFARSRSFKETAAELDDVVAAIERAVQRDDPVVAAAAYSALTSVLLRWGPVRLAIRLGRGVVAMEGVVGDALADVAIAMSRALYLTGDIEESRDLLDRARRSTVEPTRQAAALSALGRHHFDRGDTVLARTTLLQAVNQAELGASPEYLARAESALGRTYMVTGNFEEARRHYAVAHASFMDCDDPRMPAMVLARLANIDVQQGRYAEAKARYETTLVACRLAEDRRLEAIALGNLATVDLLLGKLEQARGTYMVALAAHRALGNRRSEGMALGNLGVVQKDLGELRAAERSYRASLEIHRQMKDRRGEARLLANLAGILHEQGRFEEEEPLRHEVLANHDKQGDQRMFAGEQTALAEIYLDVGKLAEARPLLDSALEWQLSIDDRRGEALTRLLLGRLAAKHTDWGEAVSQLGRSAEISLEIDTPPEFCMARAHSARALAEAGDLAVARQHLEEAESVEVELNVVRAERRIARAVVSGLGGHGDAAQRSLDEAEQELSADHGRLLRIIGRLRARFASMA